MRTVRVENGGTEHVFGPLEPVYRVARCRCGEGLRFFGTTWRLLLSQSERRVTRAACGCGGHLVVLEGRSIVAIECPENGEPAESANGSETGECVLEGAAGTVGANA